VRAFDIAQGAYILTVLTMKKAYLALENGKVFEGTSFGALGEATGEVVFNTSLTGYQEILTDPSYNGQILVMTYPEIGNYGVNPEDFESEKPYLSGFVVKEYWDYPSNWRSRESLGNVLSRYAIPGIQGIDTRELTRIIRIGGAVKGIISTIETNPETLIEKVNSSPGIVGRDLVTEVSCTQPYQWSEGTGEWRLNRDGREPEELFKRFKVAVYDFGIKRNILRELYDLGCDITVFPSTTDPKDILAFDPDGIFLSNGPGDPAAVKYASKNMKKLVGKKPIFGICLGHQILSLALGGKTFKLKFGHRGGNQPVKNLMTGKVEITSQNHGFAVDPDSLKGNVAISHINLNDQTVEGLEHKEYPLSCVQYHPEASPGPHDSSYLFRGFLDMMENFSS